MRVVPRIDFDEREREVIVSALVGHTNTLREEDGRLPVRVHLSRLREHHEPYDLPALWQLDRVLSLLIEEFTPQTTAQWWREQGAPGSDAAVEGLAQERALAVEQARDARAVVGDAEAFLARELQREEATEGR